MRSSKYNLLLLPLAAALASSVQPRLPTLFVSGAGVGDDDGGDPVKIGGTRKNNDAYDESSTPSQEADKLPPSQKMRGLRKQQPQRPDHRGSPPFVSPDTTEDVTAETTTAPTSLTTTTTTIIVTTTTTPPTADSAEESMEDAAAAEDRTRYDRRHHRRRHLAALTAAAIRAATVGRDGGENKKGRARRLQVSSSATGEKEEHGEGMTSNSTDDTSIVTTPPPIAPPSLPPSSEVELSSSPSSSSSREDDAGTYVVTESSSAPNPSAASVDTLADCNVTNPEYIGNGGCDIEGGYNTAGCNWDGGDCCWETCMGSPYRCGIYHCLDPRYSGRYNEEEELDPRRKRERTLLRNLYNATNGDEWHEKGRWLDDAVDHCYWGGITHFGLSQVQCTGGEGHVRYILLMSNNLIGTIPPSLFELQSLDMLALHENSLSGLIPTDIGLLSQLTSLILGGNELSGPLPSQLGLLTEITSLFVYDNKLTGEIVSEIGRLTKLQILALGENSLSSNIPTEIGLLSQLTYLSLSGNELSGSLPSQLGLLTEMADLYFYDNKLTGEIVSEIGQLTKLQTLSLRKNFLTASIPSEVGLLKNLTYLRLSANSLSSNIPTEIGLLSQLTFLSLESNEISGPLPSQLGFLTEITELYLYGNKLTGEIVSEIGQLTKLQTLQLWNNMLTGSLPSELGLLANLTHLGLSENSLSSNIPTEIGLLSQLTFVSLDGNELSGHLPSQLGLLTELTDLYLYGNKLTGEIVSEMGQLRKLQILQLWNNMLTGTIPSEVGLLKNLTILSLNDNSLARTIPAEIGLLTRVTHLYLHNNSLVGTTPTELGRLANLTELYLNNNIIVGAIPTEFGQLTNLTFLYLDNNDFSGSIPHQLGKAVDLIALRLDESPRLSGPVPTSFGNLTRLVQFSINNTSLFGAVPANMIPLIFRTPAEHFSPENTFDFGNLSPSNCTDVEGWADSSGRGCDWYTQNPSACTTDGNHHANLGHKAVTACCHCGLFSTYKRERKVLEELFHATSGANWFNNRMWMGTNTIHCDSWVGVECNDAGMVEKLTLPANNLVGTLPLSLVELQSLRVVDISNNDIFRSYRDPGLPIIFGKLLKLEEIHLRNIRRRESLVQSNFVPSLKGITLPQSASDLISTIPPELVSSLTALRVLDLGSNDLRGEIPSEFFQLDQLSELRLSNNSLRGTISPEIGHLGRLRILHLDNNQLTGQLPAELGRLDLLQELKLSNNHYEVSGRRLGGGSIPAELGQLVFLEYLDLSSNNFTGPIPREMSRLEKLRYLDLSDNDVSSLIPAEIGHLASLDTLKVANNTRLTEPAPLSICSSGRVNFDLGEQESWCPRVRNALKIFFEATKGDSWTTRGLGNEGWMQEYNGYCNQWFGVLCEGNKSFGEVTGLHLPSNSISGTLPAELFETLTSLKSLLLNDNLLSGQIPSSIGKLTNLSTLHLGGNKFTNDIPGEFINLSNLVHARLHDNRFSGGLSYITRGTHTQPREWELIADCGNPYDYWNDPLKCDSCTICCNSLGVCQDVPRKMLFEVSNEQAWITWTLVISLFFVFAVFMLLCCCAAGIYLWRERLPELPILRRNVRQLCGEASVYNFLVGKSRVGYLISVATVLAQCAVFLVFLHAADFGNESSDIKYTKRCPSSKGLEECESDDERSALGWAVFSFLILVKIFPDVINGLLLIYMSGKWANKRCFFAGTVLVLVSVLAIWTSAFYNHATATTDTDLIMNAVILVVVNEVDEMLFTFIRTMFPGWIHLRIMESAFYSSMLELEHNGNSSEHSYISAVDTSSTTPDKPVLDESSDYESARSHEEEESESVDFNVEQDENPLQDQDRVGEPAQLESQKVDIGTESRHLVETNKQLIKGWKEMQARLGDLEKIVSTLCKEEK